MEKIIALFVLLLTCMATVCLSFGGEQMPMHTARDKVHMAAGHLKVKVEESMSNNGEETGEEDKPKTWAGWALHKFKGVLHPGGKDKDNENENDNDDNKEPEEESVADKTKDAASKAGATVSSAAETTYDKAGSAVNAASGMASNAATNVKDTASNAATNVKDTASDAGSYVADKTAAGYSNTKSTMESAKDTVTDKANKGYESAKEAVGAKSPSPSPSHT